MTKPPDFEALEQQDIAARLRRLGDASQSSLFWCYPMRTPAERRKQFDDTDAGRIALGQIKWSVVQGLRAVEKADWVRAENMLREAERFASELVLILAENGRLDHLRKGAGLRKGHRSEADRNRLMAKAFLEHKKPGVKKHVARYAARKANPDLFGDLSDRQERAAIADGLSKLAE